MNNIHLTLKQVRTAALKAYQLCDDTRNKVLLELSSLLKTNYEEVLIANKADLERMPRDDPKYDRLLLTKERIFSIADDIVKVTKFASPLSRKLEEKILTNGIELQKISVPLGVVAVIYEARPNVTIDVFTLCFKSGNGAVLKGGSEAKDSNLALVNLIKKSLQKFNLDKNLVYLMPPERETVYNLLNAVGLIDVCIPRGSQGLIKFVRENARIPVIETGAGIVHTYFDKSGDVAKAAQIINNAKTRRVSVCNALDTLVIHADRLKDLPELVELMAAKNVEIFADEASYKYLEKQYPENLLYKADEDSFGCEFLDYKISIKTVNSVEEAIEHLMHYTSGHSEAIIAEDKLVIDKFIYTIDAAVVYVNASTAFTDAGEFGMGAEIGISTQKLHARGPMALPELTSYKWIAFGNGQIR